MHHPTDHSLRWWQHLSRKQWLLFIAATLAWFFDCLDGQLFNLARDSAMEDLLGDRAQATIYAPYTTSIFLLGWAAGGLVFGALGDRYGRARMLMWSVMIYSLCTGLSSFSTGFGDFCVYRFLTGIGVGGVFGLAVALVADSFPERSRAPALGLLQSLSTWGNILAGLIGMTIGAVAATGPLPWGLQAWQMIFLVGAAPALIVGVLLRRVEEPERWRLAHEAGLKSGAKAGSYRALLGHPTWGRNAWLGLIVCTAGIIGLWGVGNFHPKIVGEIVRTHLADQGVSPERLASDQAYWRSIALLFQNVGGFFGMITFAWIAQRFGRRPACGLALLLSFLSTLVVFLGLRDFSQIFWMLPLMGFGQLAALGVYAIYLPELFPTSLRSTGTSFCYNGGRIFAATAPFTLSRLTAHLGGEVESFRIAGAWVSATLLLGILALPFLPETRNKPLPE